MNMYGNIQILSTGRSRLNPESLPNLAAVGPRRVCVVFGFSNDFSMGTNVCFEQFLPIRCLF